MTIISDVMYQIDTILFDNVTTWSKIIPYESSYFTGFKHEGIGIVKSLLNNQQVLNDALLMKYEEYDK